MKKMQKRAIICLCFALILFLGTCFYVGKVFVDGDTWVSYPANKHIYTNGKLTTGVVKDSQGNILISNSSEDSTEYNSSSAIRKALLHTTGDIYGNIATGANVVFSDEMVGYNFVTGVYSASGSGRTINLTVNANIAKVANEALAGRSGTVGVYNYKTGEIICMVSSPNYDPLDPPTLDADDTSGTYVNRFTSSTIVPGSIFKVITATAALEQIDDIDDWTYYCSGSEQYGSYSSDKITCTSAHGKVTLKTALAKSCNCAFGKLSTMLGADTLEKYVEKSGLTSSYNIDGILTKPSTFEFSDNNLSLAWTGIGQSKDLVNPCAMMVYMGAIANGGEAASPYLISSVEFSNGLPASLPASTTTNTLINSSTANTLAEMMRNNVVTNYGEDNFPGLNICAKSGTAETSKSAKPNAWFAGFLDDDEHPYAFIVLVENSGYGANVAGSVANKVLQEAVKY